MEKKYVEKAIIGCGLGFFIIIGANIWIYLSGPSSGLWWWGWLLQILLGSVLWFYGCYTIAKGEGRHGSWATIGILFLMGLIILICLEDVNSKKWNKTAIVSFIISIIGLIFGLGLSSFGIISMLSIILGIVSARKISKNSEKLKGKRFAITGTIFGGLGLILPLWILTSVLWTIIARF